MIVKYRRLYPYAPYLNEEIGFEVSIPDDGDPIAEVETLKELCDKAHKKLNPESLPTQTDYNTGQPREIQVEKIEIGDLPTQIQSCKELKVLESYKLMVKGKADLEKLYLDKLEELSK